MKKIFVSFLLLCVVLLCGYTQLYAHTTSLNNTAKNEQNFIGVNHNANNVNLKFNTYVVKSSFTHYEKLNCEIEILDGEDDETSSIKKYFKASPYFAKSTAKPQIDYILEYIQQASFLKKFYHLISCKKYILLQVIRI